MHVIADASAANQGDVFFTHADEAEPEENQSADDPKRDQFGHMEGPVSVVNVGDDINHQHSQCRPHLISGQHNGAECQHRPGDEGHHDLLPAQLINQNHINKDEVGTRMQSILAADERPEALDESDLDGIKGER